MKSATRSSALFELNRERLVKKLPPRSLAILSANDIMPTTHATRGGSKAI